MRKIFVFFVIIFFSMLSIFLQAQVVIDQVQNAQISPSVYGTNRNIVITSTETIVAFYCWPGTSQSGLNYKVSTNGGTSWNTAVQLSNEWYNYHSHQIIDSNNHIYVVYEKNQGQVCFRKLTYNGDNTWSTGTEYEVQATQSEKANPCIYREPGGRLWIAYRFYVGASERHIYAKYSDNDGVNWSSAYDLVTFTRGSTDIGEQILLLSKGGTYPACFFGYYEPTRWSYWNGTSWSTAAEIIPGSAYTYSNLGGLNTSNNNIHLTYNASDRVYHVFYNNATETWSSITLLADVGTNDTKYNNNLTSDGVLIWCYYVDINEIVYRKQYKDGVWDTNPSTILNDGLVNYNLRNPIRISPTASRVPLMYSVDNATTDYVKYFADDAYCKWVYPATGSIQPVYSSARALQGTVYVGTDTNGTSVKGRIYALNGVDGTLKWSYENSTASYYYNIRTSCAVYKEDGTNQNIIIFGDDNGRLYKIRDNGTSATELWVVTLSSGNSIRSSPIINSTKNKIFVGCNDGFVYGVDANGSALSNWPVSIGEPVQSTPGIYVADDYLYIGADTGKVYKIAIATGTITASYPTSPGTEEIKSPIFIYYNGSIANLYYGVKNGTVSSNRGLMALNADTFAFRGNYDAGGAFNIEGSVTSLHTKFGDINNKIFFGRQDTNIFYSINDDGTTGSPLTLSSSHTVDGAASGIIYSAPIILNSYVYFGTNAGDFYSLSATNLASVKSGFPKSNASSGFQVSPGYDRQNAVFVISSTDGHIYAYQP
ncbi:MAG: PQQ-binding-like beta-propeller repeat protein [bacterium]